MHDSRIKPLTRLACSSRRRARSTLRASGESPPRCGGGKVRGASDIAKRAHGALDAMTELSVYTVGHSTRSSAEFLDVLAAAGIEVIADVRRMPGSRRLPQFDSRTLQRSLAKRGMDYCWIAQLGGRRRPSSESHNTRWRHPAFRAYADHMAS